MNTLQALIEAYCLAAVGIADDTTLEESLTSK